MQAWDIKWVNDTESWDLSALTFISLCSRGRSLKRLFLSLQVISSSSKHPICHKASCVSQDLDISGTLLSKPFEVEEKPFLTFLINRDTVYMNKSEKYFPWILLKLPKIVLTLSQSYCCWDSPGEHQCMVLLCEIFLLPVKLVRNHVLVVL